jgi:hypothetical protein
LSVFNKPVCMSLLACLCKDILPDLEATLTTACRLGLVKEQDGLFSIRFPIILSKLYKSIPKRTRVGFNKTVLSKLTDLKFEAAVLGHHAFEAEMFTEASEWYRDLAYNSYKSRDFRTALEYYERLRYCLQRCGEALTPKEIVSLATCYDKNGMRLSTDLYIATCTSAVGSTTSHACRSQTCHD